MLWSRHRKYLPVSLGHPVCCHLPVSGSLLCCLYLTDSLHSVCSFIILFVEVPLLLRICPTSSTFDVFIRRFETNYMRAAIYLAMSVIQWISLAVKTTSLIVAAIVLLITAVFYALAGVKGQGFVGSKTLGGQGVAQMIV